MLDTYEQIEIFGLSEKSSELPIPNDDVLQQQIVQDTFECLIGGFNGTGLQREVEPIAHGLATLFYRRKVTIQKELDHSIQNLQALSKVEDGSEIFQTNIENAQSKIENLNNVVLAIEVLFEQAAACYEIETGKAYIPPSGGRSFKTAHLTGAQFEAKQWIEAHEAQKAKQFEITGTPIAVAGDRDWLNHEEIFATLDKVRSRFLNSKNSDVILYHKADKKGVDAIAASWARARKVPQVTFQPNWKAHGKSGGFKAVDQMLDTPRKLGGVIIFGSTGIALNLAQKAEQKNIKVMRVSKAV